MGDWIASCARNDERRGDWTPGCASTTACARNDEDQDSSCLRMIRELWFEI